MKRWALDHKNAVIDALKRTRDRLTQFIVLVGLLSVLLAIPGWLGQIWMGMAALVPESAVQSESLVFLESEVELEARIELERTLAESAAVSEVIFIAKSEALAQLSAEDGLSSMEALIDNNPLPDALRLVFVPGREAAPEAAVMDRLSDDPRVLSARYYPSVQVQYASLVSTLATLGLVLSVLIVIGVVLTVFLVSAADVVDDRRRIELYILLGASHRFIKRPYIYRAISLGLLSGVVACLVVALLNAVMSRVLALNLESIDTRLDTIPMDGRLLLVMVCIAIGASWVGAESALTRRLRATN